jgi:hypothetical protein
MWVGAVMVVFGVLVTAGGLSRIASPEYADNRATDLFLIALCLGTIVGGGYLFSKGWRSGHEVANVLSILPAAVLLAMIAFGVIVVATQHGPPTDAYGYTALERQQIIAGCGGGARCECITDAIERSIPHSQFLAESRRYMKTGTFSPDMMDKITQATTTSGC